ncbi:MAG: NADH-quinone oxidoreductase subunit NuoH [Chloroflexi bacterium]|nr:NADH-quinone oxidoreductase subunit NuoH [Chloroflexota bacterium]
MAAALVISALGLLGLVAFITALVAGGLAALAAVGGLLAMFVFLAAVVLSLVWLERKYLGRLQMRMGPMRVGPFGLLQPVADAAKLVLKEDVTPAWVDRWLFWTAPLLLFLPSYLLWVAVPFGPGLVLRDLDLGLLYIVALSVVGIVGILMAGWGSANKYGMLGSLRSAAQLVSYEVPVIIVALTVAMMAGSLNLSQIVEAQRPVPYAVVQPLALFLFLLAGLAEVGRTPFDIYHAESEVMGGPYVEYSGAHWAVFYLAEYVNTFLVAVMVTLLFLGGWKGPGLPPVLWFLLKAYLVVGFIFWFRGTFPRLRIDQLMALGWKALVPLSFVNLVLTSIYLFYGWPWWGMSLISLAILAALGYGIHRQAAARKPAITLVPAVEVRSAR